MNLHTFFISYHAIHRSPICAPDNETRHLRPSSRMKMRQRNGKQTCFVPDQFSLAEAHLCIAQIHGFSYTLLKFSRNNSSLSKPEIDDDLKAEFSRAPRPADPTE